MNRLTVNQNGQLCNEVHPEGIWKNVSYPRCDINVVPVIDGYNVKGELINIDDYYYMPESMLNI